jgi:hypothetical protein
MRKFDQIQTKSIKLDGKAAIRVIDQYKADEDAMESICRELNAAHELAAQRFKSLREQASRNLKEVFEGTPLAEVPLDRIGFDFSHAHAHGLVFASEVKKHPIESLLEGLSQALQDVNPSGAPEGIIVETKTPVFH